LSDEPPEARQRDIWFVDLNPIIGREPAGRRPALVVSVDQVGTGPSDLCIVVPLTTTERPNPLYIEIVPPEGGVRERCWAMPEMVRSISRRRLVERWGAVRPQTLEAVVGRLRLLIRPPA
jgi:mRNA interferase MazF